MARALSIWTAIAQHRKLTLKALQGASSARTLRDLSTCMHAWRHSVERAKWGRAVIRACRQRRGRRQLQAWQRVAAKAQRVTCAHAHWAQRMLMAGLAHWRVLHLR